jgi:bifunctional aspartokinase / homoserine dehydrogenase 1
VEGASSTAPPSRVESLVPESLRGGSVEDFLRGLPGHDYAMMHLLNRARDRDQLIRYAGVVDLKKGCAVQLKNLPSLACVC